MKKFMVLVSVFAMLGCSSLNKKTLDSFTDPEFLNSQMAKIVEEVQKIQGKVDRASNDTNLWWENIKVETDKVLEKLKVLTIGINAALLQAKTEAAQAEQE